MRSLAEVQQHFVHVINHGPADLPADLFAGARDRIMLGLKAHANTISHARLTALEETFPMLRDAMGAEAFNRLSRAYVETTAARAADVADIGAGFTTFAESQSLSAALIDLAAIEQTWLESYHAADGAAFDVAALAAVPPDALADIIVLQHPATRICVLHAPPAPQLADQLGAEPDTVAILITRPERAVELIPLDDAATHIVQRCIAATSIGNLLAVASEPGGEANAAAPLLTLIGAGALMILE
ncbi:MAG: DUF2063 domain-containing protein [Sphingopyxis sp.]|nr:DUF2063 domain-containing protein [Sphingopyxis sp.]